MSDSKRATLITVGTSKSSNNNVNKTVRLTINLDESNESKYPELNYKELVTSEEFQRKKKLENGKTKGLDPFSDNDDDVEKVARKFEQKYGNKSNYGKKGRSKVDDFADIGAGYDENDSFIDNTDGYDEMIPPECDTFYGGFYINCGDLEFKSVPENQLALSDGEPGSRKNKRRISSSSSEESSDSSSESSQDEKETKTVPNGALDSHETEHRKKKNKKMDKKKPKKKQRTDSSAATSGKQTSDDNIPNEAESADSRTSDSVASKPAPSSENVPTSDSSRDIDAKPEVKLPVHVSQIVEELESLINKHKTENPALTPHLLQAKMEPNLFRLERVVLQAGCSAAGRRAAWTRVAAALAVPRRRLLRAVRTLAGNPPPTTTNAQIQPSTNTATTTTASTTTNSKRKTMDKDDLNVNDMSESEREQNIVDTLKRLKALIDEKTPGMMATYQAECERVQEERKKLQLAASRGGGPLVEKRLPKRRFPWCPRSRSLLARLARLAGDERSATALLTRRALPLFPPGFVRLPTLLRQADLSKENKASEMKRQRVGSTSNPSRPTTTPAPTTTESITFPASLTVTTTLKSSPDNNEIALPAEDKDKKTNSMFGAILNSFALSKDLLVEPDTRPNDKSNEDLYIPPNSIGSITITPVPNQHQNSEKKMNNSVKQKEPLLRVKSPAALNEMVKHDIKRDKEKPKKIDRNNEKQVNVPLHIDTSYQTIKKNPSPKEANKTTKSDHGISQKQIENMRNAENNIPRPALVPVAHSPTFAKPDKRPPEQKKKKEISIVSDIDPLGEPNEPVCVDSDSDIEVIEDTKSDSKDSNGSEVKKLSNSDVPCTDEVMDGKNNSDKVSVVSEDLEEPTDEDLDMVFRNIREMKHSQEPSMVNPYGGVITSVKHDKSSNMASYNTSFGERPNKNKFTELNNLNKTDGCNNSITG